MPGTRAVRGELHILVASYVNSYKLDDIKTFKIRNEHRLPAEAGLARVHPEPRLFAPPSKPGPRAAEWVK